MDTIQLIAEISVLKKKMDKAEAFLEELVEYLLVTCKDDDYITPEVICRKLAKYGYIELENGYWVNPLADRKTEPTISKMEQVEDEPQKDMAEDIVRSFGFKAESYQQAKAKDEPQSGYCNECKWYGDKQVCGRCRSRNLYAPKDEQTDGYMTAEQMADYNKMLDKADCKVYGNIEDEPQAERSE